MKTPSLTEVLREYKDDGGSQEVLREARAELADLRAKLDEAIAWHEGDRSPRAELERKAAAWDALTAWQAEKVAWTLEYSTVTDKCHITLPDEWYQDAGDDPAALVAEAVERMKENK